MSEERRDKLRTHTLQLQNSNLNSLPRSFSLCGATHIGKAKQSQILYPHTLSNRHNGLKGNYDKRHAQRFGFANCKAAPEHPKLVEVSGLEPLTSALQRQRSTN